MKILMKDIKKHLADLAYYFENEDSKISSFHMSYACSNRVHQCGTVACIGGHVFLMHLGYDITQPMIVSTSHAYAASRFVDGQTSKKLQKLFYPPFEVDWNNITPKEAAKAIRNYLKNGDPKWTEVLND